jgi:hypothetical protein
LGNVTLCCSDSSLLIHRMRLLLPIWSPWGQE